MSSYKWEPISPNKEFSLAFVPLADEQHALPSAKFEVLQVDHRSTSCAGSEPAQASMPAPEERAQTLLNEARRRAETIEREAFEKGFDQGERAGKETAERSLATTLQALKQGITALSKAQESRAKHLEVEVIRLAMAVAKKILQREVQAEPNVVLDVVRAALKRVNLRDEVTVKVNPMDRDTITEACPAILQEIEEIRSLTIEADETVEQGGAMVECTMGELDVRLERQLQEIERTFERMLNDRAQETDS